MGADFRRSEHIEGLISCRAGLDKLPIPISPTQAPIPALERPRKDGKKWPFAPCHYISCQRQAIQKHFREQQTTALAED